MPTPSGRTYEKPSNSRELDRLGKEIEQLRRRMDQLQKIPAPVVVSGGGPQGYTRASAQGIDYNPAYGRWSFYDWNIDQTWSNFGWTDPITCPDIFSVISSPIYHLLAPAQDGWLWQKVRFSTDSAASRLTLTLNTGPVAGGIDGQSVQFSYTIVPDRQGIFEDHRVIGPFWLPAHARDGGYAPFSVDVRHPSGESAAPTTTECTMDFIAVGI